ncbi:MAG TPA: RuvX/YqgF family protein [Synergistaceae bacterium]|nr:RuvX/YqgF family protein [Synergistaceae bacterium]
MAKRILCLDIGAVRIGVALSDPLGMFAQGVAVLSAKGKWKIELDILMERHEVALLLVGLPLRTDGSRGPEARRILDMVHALK